MKRNILYIVVFAIAMAYLESVVVVYLRELLYPEGFAFPLVLIPSWLLIAELGREAATVVMLGAVAFLAGTRRWERFAIFIVAFGIWDIFYYVWLKVLLDWPLSLLDWDILFLIPLPWIGPVIAPVLISVLMIIAGFVILRRLNAGKMFKPGVWTWSLSVVGSCVILFSFMRDTDAALHQALPQPFWYPLFFAGFAMLVGAFLVSLRESDKLE
ncbi:MAG: hypothetical protein GXO82_09080 [Chlorobi bacterium]|nr:hypothetical protein [Chlorobiota bacterium]